MNLFGLTPDRVMARIDQSEQSGKVIHIPSFKQSLLTGSLGFTCASLAVFATVAFAERWMYRNLGLAGAYLTWTLLFIALGAGLLSPLVIGPARLRRFFPLFATAFLLYAAGWVVAYFGLHARGEWVSSLAGSFAGSLLMALVMAVGFGALYTLPRLFVVLLIANSAGYFLGAWLDYAIRGKAGMLLWGLAYGLGLGAGIGWSLYLAQAPLRTRLETGKTAV
jgi:hypothetical protein